MYVRIYPVSEGTGLYPKVQVSHNISVQNFRMITVVTVLLYIHAARLRAKETCSSFSVAADANWSVHYYQHIHHNWCVSQFF